ncbi:RusA family crossover junction endodeoxyribonuclease [Microtetraspora malaysiensis]|uniref:RusA family crossover junction endodeoxyribonuclease n=1 Tax=Microtetraspora malaysiensis TaxID=161358 RepID=UPI003D8F2C67
MIQLPIVPEGALASAPFGAPLITIVVEGAIPGPQGSKKARPIYKGRGADRTFTGRTVVEESSKKVKPWRQAVQVAATEASILATVARDLIEWEPLDGPLVAEFCFSLPRGKTVKRAHPTTYPDLSKLIRSTEDALTAAAIYADDARIVRYHDPRKVYVGADDPDALSQPGAVIRIWELA